MTQAVYLMGQIDVKDLAEYHERYGKPVLEQLKRAGAEIIVASPEAKVLEGEWPGNWTVMARFPSAEAAEGWFDSAEYAPLKKRRIEELSNAGTVVMLPAAD